MKICFTVDSMNSGGAERVVSVLANQFAKDGDTVIILMVSYNVEKSFYQLDDNIKLISLVKDFGKKVQPLKRVKMLRTMLTNISPDIVISFLPHVIIYTWLALKNSDIPLIVSERNDPNQYNYIYRTLLKLAYKKADGCVFQTKAAMHWYGTDVAGKSTVIFNPVFLTCDRREVLERKKEIVTVGRLVEQKNYFFLLDVFKKFAETHEDYSLSIYGDGPLKEKLTNYSNDLKIASKVLFKGNNPNWQSEAINSKMFLLLSNYEGMPNALGEAISLGIPSVASDCPIYGSRELVEYFGCGYLVKVNDIDDTISKMEDCILERRTNYPSKDLSPKMISTEWKKYILSKTKK